jgi:4-hydroxy-3-polyprenylbenzoate decarboxylase
MIASQCLGGGYMNRFTIVVDDDIDPANMDDVVWALSTRCDPATSIEIFDRCWSGPLDPRVPPGRRSAAAAYNSRAIIDACKPFEYFDRFPKEVTVDPAQRASVLARYADQLAGW